MSLFSIFIDKLLESFTGPVEQEIIEGNEIITVNTTVGEFVMVEGELLLKRTKSKKVLARFHVYVFKSAPIKLPEQLNYVKALSPEHATVRIQEVVKLADKLYESLQNG